MRNFLRRLSLKKLGQIFLLSMLGLFVLAVAGGAIANRVSPYPLYRLENQPISPMVTDRNGNVLLSHVGIDDHWRYPVPLKNMSPWLMKATVAVEDERFWSHSGVDLISVGRAGLQNLHAGQVVSGASTLTMQINRMLDNRASHVRQQNHRSVPSTATRTRPEQKRDTGDLLEHGSLRRQYPGSRSGIKAIFR